MATVMRWGNSEGEQGRCDARCHAAEEPVCQCMCSGRFHGAALRPGGLDGAVQEFWGDVIDEARKRAARMGLDLEVLAPQLTLLWGDTA